MKLASLTLLPLVAAGMGVQPRWPVAQHNRIVDIPMSHLSSTSTHHSLEKRQFWDWLGATMQQTLPGLLRWAADNITWMLKWQESPLKRVQLRPMIHTQGNKVQLKYGPWSLTGSNETTHKTIIQMDPKSTILLRTLRGIPSDAAILSSKPALIFEDGSPATFAEGMYVLDCCL
jgi:hypothetical protein